MLSAAYVVMSTYLGLNWWILALDNLIERSPFTFNIINMKPAAWELKPLPLQYALTLSVHLHLKSLHHKTACETSCHHSEVHIIPLYSRKTPCVGHSTKCYN